MEGLDGTIDAGDKVELACSVQRGKPLATEIVWLLDGEILQGERTESVKLDITKENNGQTVACRASNSVGSVNSKEVILDVLCQLNTRTLVLAN